MDSSTAKYYIKDLGQLIKGKAIEAKKLAYSSGNSYDLGFLMAYHDLVSLMQSQAIAFGIPFDEIGLSNIDPEVDLL